MIIHEIKYSNSGEIEKIIFLYDDDVTYIMDCKEAGVRDELDFLVRPTIYEDYFAVLEDYAPPAQQSKA